MNESSDKLDKTNELLEKLVSIQEDVSARQLKFLKLYKAVLSIVAVFLVIYIAINIYIL